MAIEVGTPVLFDPVEDTWRIGILVDKEGPAVWPMAEHIVRDVELVCGESIVEALPLQPDLPEPENKDGAARIVSQAGRIICQRLEADPTRYQLFVTTEEMTVPIGMRPDSYRSIICQ